ncbi:MAG TPA: hypothetical protein DD761_14640 [Cyanobacteria bacterium UBA11691]|nr:hypothetical protein [Cyanobacteria bacterium UBA11691]
MISGFLYDTESEFYLWYEAQMKGTKALENDIIIVGDAIEVVKKNYLNDYELTNAQRRNIQSRKSWMKACSINLLYGFRASEFKAILNLDEPVTRGGYTFKALHDPDNNQNILVIDEGFWVTDTSGKKHWITTKTGKRIARPMIHPDYPDLVEVMDVKNPLIKLPEMVPKANSTAESLKFLYSRCMSERLKG